MIFGDCGVATAVAARQMASEMTAAQWHANCHGAIMNTRGEVTRCDCECHPADLEPYNLGNICTHCGDDKRDKHQTEDGLRCNNTEACEFRFEELMESNPSFRQQIEIARETANQKVEERKAESTKPHTAKRKGGRCEHCGKLTAGGRFAPGHDAKLKSELTADCHADIEALAELIVRGWPHNHVMPDDLELAGQIATADDMEVWFAARVAARAGRHEEDG